MVFIAGALILIVIFAIAATNQEEKMTHAHGLIRTIYLYLFALVGLFFFIFGVVNGVGATLNRFVWPQEFVKYDYSQPAPVVGETKPEIGTTLTEEKQKEQFVSQQNNEFRRRMTESFPAMLIGWLLWWFHWGWIKRDAKNLVRED